MAANALQEDPKIMANYASQQFCVAKFGSFAGIKEESGLKHIWGSQKNIKQLGVTIAQDLEKLFQTGTLSNYTHVYEELWLWVPPTMIFNSTIWTSDFYPHTLDGITVRKDPSADPILFAQARSNN